MNNIRTSWSLFKWKLREFLSEKIKPNTTVLHYSNGSDVLVSRVYKVRAYTRSGSTVTAYVEWDRMVDTFGCQESLDDVFKKCNECNVPINGG